MLFVALSTVDVDHQAETKILVEQAEGDCGRKKTPLKQYRKKLLEDPDSAEDRVK